MDSYILKRLDELLWYNNKYIHKIEDTFFTFLTKEEICNYYLHFSNNMCETCQSCQNCDVLPNKIDDEHPSLWNYTGCKCNYFQIALSNTYREYYNKKY